MFTRVHTTCEIPVSTVFGPCELQHTSAYDSIAFIALKSMDRRTSPYIIKQVHTSMRANGLVWLRLVQSARCPVEQNLEAYLKNGQLFYRALRRIEKDEELLVWYSKDLAKLLLLHPLLVQRKGAPPYICPHCSQSFDSKFPFLAHRRFLCSQRMTSNSPHQHSSPSQEDFVNRAPKDYTSHAVKPESSSSLKGRTLDSKPGTDFHNLARDMERKADSTVAQSRNLKRKHCKVEEDEIHCDLPQPMVGEPLTIRKHYAASMSRQSSFIHQPIKALDTLSESRSAFSQPPHPAPASFFPQAPLLLVRTDPNSTSLWSKAPRFFLQTQAQPHAKALLPQTQALHTQAQALPTPHVLLSPSLSPLRLQGQNWCARCSLSFRLTSDLVAHMRTVHHHQRVFSARSGVDRIPRGDKRHSCPICREVFKQRHHLARHLVAHT
ncbi:PR domain zinc finger protein 8 [Hypomesus transpacificus]|uniref:PR domain zinc finger protein 8 n=1 Tax=Hypomesus transpacificus TaxID=137520 RepID=UPI001F08764F|nr:PR domain zinc finger protein 8 [Hypomesus transpacificus]